MQIGQVVTVRKGFYAGKSGPIVQIHDPDVRLRRYDVKLPEYETIRCFSKEELEH